jgi:hypothetical protein
VWWCHRGVMRVLRGCHRCAEGLIQGCYKCVSLILVVIVYTRMLTRAHTSVSSSSFPKLLMLPAYTHTQHTHTHTHTQNPLSFSLSLPFSLYPPPPPNTHTSVSSSSFPALLMPPALFAPALSAHVIGVKTTYSQFYVVAT